MVDTDNNLLIRASSCFEGELNGLGMGYTRPHANSFDLSSSEVMMQSKEMFDDSANSNQLAASTKDYLADRFTDFFSTKRQANKKKVQYADTINMVGGVNLNQATAYVSRDEVPNRRE